jgi:hypothetical protein
MKVFRSNVRPSGPMQCGATMSLGRQEAVKRVDWIMGDVDIEPQHQVLVLETSAASR